MKAVLVLTTMLTLTGCASNLLSPRPGSCPAPSADQQLTLNLADEMINDGRLYASLANLEGLPDNLVQVRLRKARILRQLGRYDAERLYKGLLGTCLAAEGEHGLGQLAAARDDNTAALEHLERAAKMAPTDEKIRNDLGVVYLNQRRISDARFEFLTALELKQSDSLAALNMVTLLIFQDNWNQAAELAGRANLSPKQISEAQARAEKLKAQGQKAVASESIRPTKAADASSNRVIN